MALACGVKSARQAFVLGASATCLELGLSIFVMAGFHKESAGMQFVEQIPRDRFPVLSRRTGRH